MVDLTQRKNYALDPNVAAYYWEAMRNGVIVAAEFDAAGNEHRLVEIPGIEHRGGLDFVLRDDAQPFTLYARPYRPGTHVELNFEIEPGMGMIWLHRAWLAAAIGTMTLSGGHFEMLVIGRRHRDGREEVLQMWPDGRFSEHGSVAEAMSATRTDWP